MTYDDRMGDLATAPTLIAPDPLSLAGRVLADRYELLELLGAGGMGAVFRAHDRELDELVALKLLRPEIASDGASLVRFRREVKLARRVTHRNVARTFDLGVDGAARFLTMELIEGESLASHARRQRIALAEVLRLAEEISRGLAAAHAVGVVHRDLKPDNVMLSGDRVVLTDFGIAQIADGHDGARRTGSIIGTPAYMAPEQLDNGAVDGRTDVYALGTLLYELLVGALPFPASSPVAGAAQRLIADAPDPRASVPDMPEPLARLLRDALARRREGRPDAQSFVDRIEHLRGRATVGRAGERLPTLDHEALGRLVAPSAILVADMVASPPHEALARGLTEAVLDALTEARTRVGRVSPLEPRVSAEANDLVLQSSLHVSGERARARARLLEGAGGTPVWASYVEGPTADAFALEDALAARVCEAVRDRAARDVGPADPAIRASYNKALAAFDRFALPSVEEAIATLEEVERASPGDPHVRGLLAQCLARAFLQLGGTDGEMSARAEELALRALEVNPRVAHARYTVAMVRLLHGELAAGLRALEETVRTSPAYAASHGSLGVLLSETGHPAEGARRIELAIRLEPTSVIFQVERAQLHALVGERARADAILTEVARKAGPMATIVVEIRLAVWWNDRERAAQCAAILLAAPGAASWKSAAGMMTSIARGERFAESTEVFARLTDPRTVPRHRARMYVVVTEYHSSVGALDEAFSALATLAELPFVDVLWMDLCPALEPMRADPRFSKARATIATRAAALWG